MKFNIGGRAVCYLLHFNERICPTHPCQHYLGYTKDLDSRIREHKVGLGSRLCQVAKERGISFQVAEVWLGNRSLEHLLKRQKNAPKFCPICQKSLLKVPSGIGRKPNKNLTEQPHVTLQSQAMKKIHVPGQLELDFSILKDGTRVMAMPLGICSPESTSL